MLWSSRENMCNIAALPFTQDVHLVTSPMCAFGLQVEGPQGHSGLAYKPTRWMTNAPWLAESLRVSCSRDHEHLSLMGGWRGTVNEVPQEECLAFQKIPNKFPNAPTNRYEAQVQASVSNRKVRQTDLVSCLVRMPRMAFA